MPVNRTGRYSRLARPIDGVHGVGFEQEEPATESSQLARSFGFSLRVLPRMADESSSNTWLMAILILGSFLDQGCCRSSVAIRSQVVWIGN